jgi:ATP-dependent DNA helicase PIF1
LGGDFRQILPVVPKGPRPEIVRSTINSSYLWNECEVLTLTTNMRLLTGSTDSDIEETKNFSEWILGIGDGTIGVPHDLDITLQIPQDLLIKSFGGPLSAIVQSTYPNLLNNINDPSFFSR